MSLIQIINDFLKVKLLDNSGNPIFTNQNPGKVEVVNNQQDSIHVDIPDEKKTPHPPKIDIEIITPDVHGGRLPSWLDNSGNYWASHQEDGLFKSEDNCKTWIKVADSPNTSTAATSLMVSDEGIVIWGTGGRNVYKWDGASWTTAFTFIIGYSHQSYGYSKYKNVLLMTSYGSKDNTPSPKECYGSLDHGKTWNKIYDGGDMLGYHIHEAAYDPWGGRIWISEGDIDRRQLVYSDDFGKTWNKVWENYGEGIQPTQIIPTPHGVLFGSDQVPDGIYYWERPKGVLNPIVRPEDIDRKYYLIEGEEQTGLIKNLFRRGWSNIESELEPTFLFAASPSTYGSPGFSRIIASDDGKNFHEIWKAHSEGDYIIRNLTGPYVNDESKTFFGIIAVDGVGDCIIKGRYPKFL